MMNPTLTSYVEDVSKAKELVDRIESNNDSEAKKELVDLSKKIENDEKILAKEVIETTAKKKLLQVQQEFKDTLEKINFEGIKTELGELTQNITNTEVPTRGGSTAETTEGAVDSSDGENIEIEKRNLFEKGWDKIKEYNEDIKKDRENGEKGKAVGKVALEATGLALVGWIGNKIFKGAKRLFGGKAETTNNESDATKTANGENQDIIINNINGKKKNRIQRNLGRVIGGAGAAGVAYYFRDKLHQVPLIGPRLDGLINDKLSMEEALLSVEGNMLANANEDHLKQDIRLNRNPDNNKLSAFGKEFSINPETRTIEGLNIKFKDYEELITTCIMIGSAEYNFKGQCVSQKPFSISPLGGDIEVHLTEGTKDHLSGQSSFPVGKVTGGVLGATLGGVLGYYAGRSPATIGGGLLGGGTMGAIGGDQVLDRNDTLSRLCPTLNDDNNKKRLVGYLNGMGGWEAGRDLEIDRKAQTDDKEVNSIFAKTFKEIQDIPYEEMNDDSDQGTARNARISNFEGHNDVYSLTTRGKRCLINVGRDSSGNINSASIEDTDIVFRGSNVLEQVLRLGSFINLCEKKFAGQSYTSEPFTYTFDVGASALENGNFRGLYFKNKNNFARLPIISMKMSEDDIEKYIPELMEGDNMDNFIARMNTRKSSGSSLRTNETGSGRYNTYEEKIKNSADPIGNNSTTAV